MMNFRHKYLDIPILTLNKASVYRRTSAVKLNVLIEGLYRQLDVKSFHVNPLKLIYE